MSQRVLIEEIVDSKISTDVLERMLVATKSMIRNIKIFKGDPNQMWDWEAKLRSAISIRKAMNE